MEDIDTVIKRYECDIRDIEFNYGMRTARLARKDGHIRIELEYNGAYGMGEKYNSLNQKSLVCVNRVMEKFCFQGDKTYCSTPFFWTDTGFGIYIDTLEETTFSFGEAQVDITLPEDAGLVLFAGSPKEIVSEYMKLWGPAVLPPDWAFDVWISANRWNTQEETELQIAKLQRYGFHAGVIVLEAWSDEATFYIWNGAKYTPVADGRALSYDDFNYTESPWPDPKKMIEKLHENGLKLVLWQIPVYKKQGPDEVLNVQNELDKENAVNKKLCVMDMNGEPYTIPEGNWFAGSEIPDFTNRETVQSWFAKRQYLLDIGVDGFKTDGGEFIYRDDLLFADGTCGKKCINKYSSDYTHAYTDFIGNSRVLFSRAGFSGQHTVAMHWAGDQQSQNSELRSVLRAGLSAASSGIIFWGFDIAGFAGPLPTMDLYERATQMACFCPIMQWHSEPDGGQFKELMPGGEGNNERSPWNIADAYGCPELIDRVRFWHDLRHKLLPYITDCAEKCVEANEPMMKPLVYEFPEDTNVVNCEDEYLFGPSLLVAPLLEENSRAREVYLPEGVWVSIYDGVQYAGNSSYQIDFDGKIPVFCRKDSGFDCILA